MGRLGFVSFVVKSMLKPDFGLRPYEPRGAKRCKSNLPRRAPFARDTL